MGGSIYPALLSQVHAPDICLARVTMGGFPSDLTLSTVYQGKTMSRTKKLFLPTVMIFSALVLSACATKPKEAVVAEPAPVAVVAEQAPVVEPTPAPAVAAEQPAPAPVMMAEQPAPKPVVKKARKKTRVARTVPPKVVEPEPVAAPAPAPMVQQEAPAAAPPAVAAPQPIPEAAAPGFLEKYWLWLLGLIVAAIAAFVMIKK